MKLTEKQIQDLRDKKISLNDLAEWYFVEAFASSVEDKNILQLLNNKICTFKELVDKIKNLFDSDFESHFHKFLYNNRLFEELIENNKITTGDLKYVLNKIDNSTELHSLCENLPLIKRILNEFILDKENVDRLNTIIEKDNWCKEHNIHNIFEYIRLTHTIHEHRKNNEKVKEIVKLNELNKYVCRLDKDEKSEIVEILRDNKKAQNTLIQIVENSLEDQYDFESLKKMLNKDNEKKKIKFNF